MPERMAHHDPVRALAAFLRGRDLRVDVMGAWNYWDQPLPLVEAQARLGLAVPPAP